VRKRERVREKERRPEMFRSAVYSSLWCERGLAACVNELVGSRERERQREKKEGE